MILDWIGRYLSPLVKNERLAEYKMLVEELRQSRAEYKEEASSQRKKIEQLEEHVIKQSDIIKKVLQTEKACLDSNLRLADYVRDLREYVVSIGGNFREFIK